MIPDTADQPPAEPKLTPGGTHRADLWHAGCYSQSCVPYPNGGPVLHERMNGQTNEQTNEQTNDQMNE